MLSILALVAVLAVAPAPGPSPAASAASAMPARPDSSADTSSFAASVHDAYAREDVATLRTLLARAPSFEDRLLARYRLYPITEDESVIDDIPSDLPDDASARTAALLSGLWAYRAGEASLFGAMRCGRRSVNLLDDAREIDADDPFVLLVEGQSLLFRPAIAGRDVDAAVERFRTLVDRVTTSGDADGISVTEAKTWLWLALREADRSDDAQTLHDELLATAPAPLFRQFLLDPPQV